MVNLRPVVFVSVILSCAGSWASRSTGKAHRTHKLPHLYWNTSNPIFRIDNTDHIIDVNQGTLPHEYDQINIICPVYHRSVPEEETERFVIYNVNREEYETCRILNQHPRIVAGCTEPYTERFFTISFRSFSPMPNTLEFKAGEDYYFISTSSKDDIHRRIHGDCMNHNMKVVFKVADSTKKQNKSPTLNRVLGESAVASTTIPTSFQIFTAGTERRAQFRPSNYTSYYVNTELRQENQILMEDKSDHVSLVKKVRDKIKQEASTKISSGSSALQLTLLWVLCLGLEAT